MTDSQLKSAIEGVVIKWVHQVEEVLTQDTDDLVGADHFPKPLEEISFWGKRRENLTHISNQLKDKKVTIRCMSSGHFIKTSVSGDWQHVGKFHVDEESSRGK